MVGVVLDVLQMLFCLIFIRVFNIGNFNIEVRKLRFDGVK